jgi:hypothetical protein
MISGELGVPIGWCCVCVFFLLLRGGSCSCCCCCLFVVRYFIRKERGLVKDPKTNRAPNRKPEMRYTELGDDLVTELGRIGQKAGKVRLTNNCIVVFSLCPTRYQYFFSAYSLCIRVGTTMTSRSARDERPFHHHRFRNSFNVT